MTDATVQYPFKGKWEVFKKQFKVRFGAANKKVDVIRELEHMKQGGKAVTVYSQDFRDAGAKTGLSDADLMIRFRSGLNPEVKKLLVTMDLAQGDRRTWTIWRIVLAGLKGPSKQKGLALGNTLRPPPQPSVPPGVNSK
ncbi:hypothetical protein PQX77_021115 [Marasmius sp. AFHP31]|nr:hypothetical protein PQX77_021115 [Marasmius sp. AFHP31]